MLLFELLQPAELARRRRLWLLAHVPQRIRFRIVERRSHRVQRVTEIVLLVLVQLHVFPFELWRNGNGTRNIKSRPQSNTRQRQENNAR